MPNYKKENNCFAYNDFKNPPTINAPMYSWVWNAPISHEETDRQLEEMKRLGIKFFYIIPEPKSFRPITIPTLMEPDYLTPPYFEEYKYAIEKAKSLGMSAWLYDEGGWPSGGACGKVMLKDPDLGRRMLVKNTVTVKPGEVYTPSEGTLASFINVDTRVNSGESFDSDTEITEYYIKNMRYTEMWRAHAEFPDVTRKEAIDSFIEITHEGYKPYLKEHFGDMVSAVFNDEPMAMSTAFREDLAEEYEKRTGRSILPYLPYLCNDAEVPDELVTAVSDWYDMLNEHFCNNFLLNEREWCNKNGLLFVGHLNIDDTPNGSIRGGNFGMMRALRCFDIPGIDVIWRQIHPCEKRMQGAYELGTNHFFPRFAASAAAQNGSRYAVTESFGVYGAGLTFDEMRWISTFQAIRGINLFNLMNIPYGREGWLMNGEMPYFIECQACYSDLAVFNRFLERLSYVSSLGERVCNTALYYPIQSFNCRGNRAKNAEDTFNGIGFALEAAHIGFDVIDDDIIRGADINGAISFGNARYTTIVTDPSFDMPEDVRTLLDNFKKSGGRVITKYEIPSLTAPVKFACGGKKIMVMERRLENGKLILISNENLTPANFTLDTNGNSYKRLNLTDGTVINCTGNPSINLESGELIALIDSDDAIEVSDMHQYTNETILADFALRREKRMRIGKMTYESEIYSDKPTPTALGDWQVTVGSDYSGSCIYSTEFECPDVKELLLDLGEVRYTAEVFVNGISQGTRVMCPYTFKITAPLKANNLLEIRVSNTPANEYLSTKSFDKWQDWQMSPYPEISNEFSKESLSSGLFGPVQLKYNRR